MLARALSLQAHTSPYICLAQNAFPIFFFLLYKRLSAVGEIFLRIEMLSHFLLGLAACSSVINAAPLVHGVTDLATPHLAAPLFRRAAVDSCPGYTASNVVKDDSTLTADLTLAGDACNAYSDDIKNLKLLVEYQTSMFFSLLQCIQT